jgi:K+-sensing histidine kinase KdpD
MTFTFLQEELESILIFVTAPIYLTIVSLLQSKNLKILNSLKRKKKTDLENNELKKKLIKLKYLTPVFMLIGLAVHITLYLIFSSENIRLAYFISISIMYIIYVLIAIINFYLKGAGVLKDVGNFNGLPGN